MNRDVTSGRDEVVPHNCENDEKNKIIAKNHEGKMMLYYALPKNEYERIFMCKITKEIWELLIITHQENSQVKDNKIAIFEDETIDSGFAHFNIIITSLKALDESFGSKNFVRKLLRARHPKWRAKKDSEIIKGKRYKLQSIALKAKMKSSDDEESSSNSEDKDY
ncbi:hypothetical protein Tco_0519328 [Tanacetum coccineum]